jgi:hypothetical protein
MAFSKQGLALNIRTPKHSAENKAAIGMNSQNENDLYADASLGIINRI